MNYTFANFVVGSSNQFAHAASLAVANLPAQAYNPLFLYGGVGLGKTHLLQAICYHLRQHGVYVTYLSAERFMNELVSSLQRGRMEAFRERYREVDALVMDDVQFLCGKDRTQEEFFHTFNALYDSGRQIIVASDKPPQELLSLQERLRSRLASGLIADLQPPDLETRVAILCRKAEESGFVLSPGVAMLVASRVCTHVRELEGCLTRIGAYASLHGQGITTELAEFVLQQLFVEREQGVTAKRIQQQVSEHFGLRMGELKSSSRLRSITFPRQIAMFLCRELTDDSLPEIGRHFGGRDHTTVLHACAKIAHLEKTDEQMAHLLWQLRRSLGSEVWKS
jgi:chromosomal replication initiator protein